MRFIGNLTVFPVIKKLEHRSRFDEVGPGLTATSWRTIFRETMCLLSTLDVPTVTCNWSIHNDDRE